MKLNQKGSALIIAVVILFFLGVIITAAVIMTKADTKMTSHMETKQTFFNAADAGAEYVYAMIRSRSTLGNNVATKYLDAAHTKEFKVINISRTPRMAAGYSIDIGGTSKPFVFIDYSFTSIGTYASKDDSLDVQITFGPVPAGTGY